MSFLTNKLSQYFTQQIAFKLKELEVLEKDATILQKIYFEEMDGLRKAQIKKQITKNNEAQETLIFEIANLKSKLASTPHINFSKILYESLIEYDFVEQRTEFTACLRQISHVGAFVIHGEDYEQSFQQEWLWKHIFLNYFDEDIRHLSIFTPYTSSILQILYEFKLSINQEKYRNEYILDNQEIEKEIKVLVKEIALLLQNYSITISIHTQTLRDISLFTNFIEQIWQPVCQGLSELEDVPKHRLLLFIIDNKLKGEPYYTKMLIESLTLFKPYRIPKIKRLYFSDLQHWIKNGIISRKSIFFRHENLCRTFLGKFAEEHHFSEYLPPCGRIEKLFEKICCDLHNDHFKLDFQSLRKEHGKKIH